MNIVDIYSTVKTSLSCFTHEYSGDTDIRKFRNGKGKELWKHENRKQSFIGSFIQDSLHGYGIYKWNEGNLNYTYEGNLYANNLEGYGQLSYTDGKIYEGLFSLNRRYGPGVLTYSDGNQDVGLWDGLHLIRLNQTLSANIVPRLTHTSMGTAYLLRYKTLVPIREKFNSELENILNNEDCQNENRLYSNFVRNPNSIFFNKDLYYNSYSYFQKELDFTVNVMESTANGETFTREVAVTHLLAWNNEALATSLMKHSFRHRNSETLLSYPVSHVLTGQRKLFRSPGMYETLCLNLLESCCDDNEQNIMKLICENDLYPDLSDSLGNTGMTYAASKDHVRVIKLLVDFGANVDHVNDECLTPLLICILRYLSLKNGVIDWERAFLPPVESKDENPEIQQWRTQNHSKMKDRKSIEIEGIQKYIFNLECIHPNLKTNIQQKKRGKKKKQADKKIQKINFEPEKIDGELKIVKDELLQKIYNTIRVLLDSGANPNCGEVPFPPLILSLFTKDETILSQLIQFGANTNITTSIQNGGLSALHIIMSLPPSPELAPLAEILLTNGANPNSTANIYHWIQEQDILLAGTQTSDSGKTPLHLLCMRWDFEEDICDHLGETFTMLMRYGADSAISYLGHTVLSLAILRGNTRLMVRILESGLVDPNEPLGNDMGVPLTVLTLKRYTNILPLNTTENVYNILLQYYANPLNNVSGFDGNTVEFAIKDNTLEPVEKSENKSVKRKEKNTSKKSTGNDKVIQHLKDCSSKTLVKHLQAKAVKLIYDYKIQCEIDDVIFKEIAGFVNLEDTVKILQVLIDNEKIFVNKSLCYETMKYINNQTKTKSSSKKRNSSKRSGSGREIVDDLFNTLDFNKNTELILLPFGLCMPDIDPDEEKYKVCFECLQKTNRDLVLCPKCELVYFCSQQCNIINNKRNTKHGCKIVFYDSEKKKLEEEGVTGRINKFDKFKNQKEMLEKEPGYLENLKLKYSSETGVRFGRLSRKDMFEARNRKRKKSKEKGKKSKSKSSKTKSGSSKSQSKNRDKSKRKKKKDKSKSGSKIREKSKNVRKKGKSKEDSERNKGKAGGNKKSKTRDRDKSDGKKKGKRLASSRSKSRQKDKDKKDRIKSSSKQRGKHESRNKKTVKSRAGSATKKSKALKVTREKHSARQRSKSRVHKGEKLQATKVTFDDRSKSTRRLGKDKKSKTEAVSEGVKSQSVSREREASKSRRRSEERKFELARKLREGLISDEYLNMISDVCEFNARFYEMFMPYCVFIDGQLYYKFDGTSAFCKLTYSNV